MYEYILILLQHTRSRLIDFGEKILTNLEISYIVCDQLILIEQNVRQNIKCKRSNH